MNRLNERSSEVLTFQPTIYKIIPNFKKIKLCKVADQEKNYLSRIARAKKIKEEKEKLLNPDYSKLSII
jgi:hypothetical protein